MTYLKRLLFLFALLVCGHAFAVTTSVNGTTVRQAAGQIMTAGNWCFNGTCIGVGNGNISGSVTSGTNTVTIINPAGTVTYLTVPGVTITGATFNWDTFTQTGAATGIGAPYLACSLGATYTQTDIVQSWACNNVAGQAVWQTAQTGTNVSPAGSYQGFGHPNFICTAPCTYTDYSSSPFWSTTANSGFNANSWVQMNPSIASLFSTIGGGTNTSAPMVVGSGASLTSGGGLIAATALNSTNITGNPASSGQVLVSTGPTGAQWQTGGTGSVTSLSASTWPSWLSPTVANPTTTPALSVSASPIPNAALASSAITINSQTMNLGGSYTLPIGGVSSVAAGNTALFTSTVTNPTSTPSISFTVAPAAANTVYANPTGSSTTPTFTSSPVLTAVTAASVTASGLTPGNCVQAGTGGLLVSTSAPCGSGSGGSSADSIVLVDTVTSIRYAVYVAGGQLRNNALGSTGTASAINGLFNGSSYYALQVTSGALHLASETSSYPSLAQIPLTDTTSGTIYNLTVTSGGALQISTN